MPVIRSLMVVLSFTLLGLALSLPLVAVALFLTEAPLGQAAPGLIGDPVESAGTSPGRPLWSAPLPRGVFVWAGWLMVAGSALGACLGAWIAARRRFYRWELLDWYEVSQELGWIIDVVRGLLAGWTGTVTLAATLVCLGMAIVLSLFKPQSSPAELRFVCWVLGGWPFVYWLIILRGPPDETGLLE